jgi:nucleotide-binding universal stress UspA family protein
MTTSSHPVVVGIVDKQPSVLGFAVGEARAAHSSLWVVHSTGRPPQPGDYYGGFDLFDELSRTGQAVLDDARRFVEEEAPELEVEYVLTSEGPRHALEHAVPSARLLVVGSDDVPWFDRLMRTDVAGHLALHAACPVVVVPEQAYPWARDGDVVVTLDGDTSAEGPLQLAFEEADARDAVLHVLHATPPGTIVSDAEEIRANLAEVVAGWRDTFPDVIVLTAITTGDPKKAVAHATESAALVVVGRPHGRVIPFAVSRPLATDVLRRAHCPVAVVPPTYRGV